MTKQEQQELKTLLDVLARDSEYRDTQQDNKLIHDNAFIRLYELANQERFTEVQPKPLTSLTFEQLLLMRNEATLQAYDSRTKLSGVLALLQDEILKRLHALAE